MTSLRVLAGQVAYHHIKEHGLKPQDIKVVLGASGGPKWLVLAGLDRMIFGNWLPDADHKIDLIGSSIGAWRMAAAAHPDPDRIIARFQAGYFAYKYQKSDTVDDITRHTDYMLNLWIGDEDKIEICSNRQRPLHIVTTRSRGLLDSRRSFSIAAGLFVAGFLSLFSRRGVAGSFDRVVFSTASELPYRQHWSNFTTIKADLTARNLSRVIQASSSIPGITYPERDIAGAPPGIYRDGGFIDYHFDSPFKPKEGLVLYPHFYPYLIPGWFDKLVGRKTPATNLSHTILLAPSKSWIKSLPGQKIPDRNDFLKMSNEKRIEVWGRVMTLSKKLAEDFERLIDDRHYLQSILESL